MPAIFACFTILALFLSLTISLTFDRPAYDSIFKMTRAESSVAVKRSGSNSVKSDSPIAERDEKGISILNIWLWTMEAQNNVKR